MEQYTNDEEQATDLWRCCLLDDARLTRCGARGTMGRCGPALARWGGGLDPCAPADFFAPHSVWLDSRGAIYVGEVNWSAGGNEGMIPADCPCLRRYLPV